MNIPSLLIQVISLLVSSSLIFRRNSPKYLKVFPFFLLVTVIIEIIGWRLVVNGINATLLYNLFTTLEFEFYLFLLYNIIQNPRFRKVILYCICFYPVLVIANISLIQVNTFHSITYAFGCLLIVTVCIYYFLELFQYSKSIDLKREPAFWMCSGLLFFYCCSFPLFGLLNFIHDVSGVIMRNLASIVMILNILLYSAFIVAFLCNLKAKNELAKE
jgi:hypothetical protein